MANKERQLFTLDKINVDFLNKYCQLSGIPKSRFINDIVTEIRQNSDSLFGNFLIDNEKMSEIDGFMFLANAMKKMNDMQVELLQVQKDILYEKRGKNECEKKQESSQK